MQQLLKSIVMLNLLIVTNSFTIKTLLKYYFLILTGFGKEKADWSQNSLSGEPGGMDA